MDLFPNYPVEGYELQNVETIKALGVAIGAL